MTRTPLAIVNKAWRHHVVRHGTVIPGLHLCVLDRWHRALRRRERFVAPSVRYADPRLGLLEGEAGLVPVPSSAARSACHRPQPRLLQHCGSNSITPTVPWRRICPTTTRSASAD